MSFYKEGTPNKIGNVTKSEAEFDALRQRIASENNLVRCGSCDHLLAKRSSDGALDVQHKRLSMTSAHSEGITMKCPVCNSVTAL